MTVLARWSLVSRSLTSSPGHAAAVGGLSTSVVVLAAGQVGPPGYAHPFTRWGGLLSPDTIWADIAPWPGVLLAMGLLAFVGVWLSAVSRVLQGAWSERTVWVLGAVWALPLTVGPPILSNDVFSYVAQGAVAQTGADPSQTSPFALGWTSPLLQAVDPRWRDTPSPYGPLTTLMERIAVSAGGLHHPLVAVIVLRVIALAAVAGIAVVASSWRRTVVGDQDPVSLATITLLTWANPLLLLHVVAAVHLEGLLVLLVLIALRLAAVGRPAAYAAAAVFVSAAAAVKLPVGGVGALVIVAGIVHTAPTRQSALRRVVLTVATGVTTWAVLCDLAGSGWNLSAVLRTPSAGRTPAAPATIVADLLTPMRWWTAANGAELDHLCRILFALAAVVGIGYLILTARRRPTTVTAGMALLTLAAGSPVLYPWYLTWSVPLLSVALPVVHRRRVVLLSALGSVMTVQGLTHAETYLLATTVGLAVVTAVWFTEPRLRAFVCAVPLHGIRIRQHA